MWGAAPVQVTHLVDSVLVHEGVKGGVDAVEREDAVSGVGMAGQVGKVDDLGSQHADVVELLDKQSAPSLEAGQHVWRQNLSQQQGGREDPPDQDHEGKFVQSWGAHGPLTTAHR